MSDDQGNPYHQTFDPFGAPLNTLDPLLTRVGFTGQQHDPDIGLVDMKGRMYDPLTGRFMSPDPIMQAPFFSQGLNRYSYVFNDPVNKVDPSGFVSFEADIVFSDTNLYGNLGYTQGVTGSAVFPGAVGSGLASAVGQGVLAAAANVAIDLIVGLPGQGSAPREVASVAPSAAPKSTGFSQGGPQAVDHRPPGPPLPDGGLLLAQNEAPDASVDAPRSVSDATGPSEPSWFEKAWNGLKNVGRGVVNEVRDFARGTVEFARERAAAQPIIVTITPKILKQMGPRGWTQTQIDEALQSGQRIPAVNKCVFRPIAIAHFGAWRSPISVHRDRPFRSIPITHFGHADHFSTGPLRGGSRG